MAELKLITIFLFLALLALPALASASSNASCFYSTYNATTVITSGGGGGYANLNSFGEPDILGYLNQSVNVYDLNPSITPELTLFYSPFPAHGNFTDMKEIGVFKINAYNFTVPAIYFNKSGIYDLSGATLQGGNCSVLMGFNGYYNPSQKLNDAWNFEIAGFIVIVVFCLVFVRLYFMTPSEQPKPAKRARKQAKKRRRR